MRVPAAIDSTTRHAVDVRRERRAGLAHLLRLHGEHDERRRRRSARRATLAEDADAGKAFGEPCALRVERLDDDEVGAGRAVGDQAADQRGRHVAAADEGDAHGSGRSGAEKRADVESRIASICAAAPRPLPHRVRAPKIAVPTRTSVEPSAIAASRSAVMPIDSVSTRRPARARLRRGIRAARANCARCFADVVGRLGDAHEAAQRAAAAAPRPPRASADAPRPGATPLFVASPLTLTWTSTSSGGRSAARAADSRSRDLQPVDAFDPVEHVGRQRRLVALERADQHATARSARSASAARLAAASCT